MPRIKIASLPGLSAHHRRFPELTYACPNDPRWKRWFISRMETLSGRNFFAKRYDSWREAIRDGKPAMGSMLELLNITLRVHGDVPAPEQLPEGPLVIIANHPFGIGDGVAILSIAEKMGRPFRILINNELLKVPEIEPYALPISFEETKDALKLNLETRKQAVQLLEEGVTIIVFPSGGVATATKGFGKAQDLPWKRFPAKLVQAANASVLPVYFEGQCGRSFHLASRFSLTLRTALLIREFRRLVGKDIHAHMGEIIPGRVLERIRCRSALTDYLHDKVFALGNNPRGNTRTEIVSASLDCTPEGVTGNRPENQTDEAVAA